MTWLQFMMLALYMFTFIYLTFILALYLFCLEKSSLFCNNNKNKNAGAFVCPLRHALVDQVFFP